MLVARTIALVFFFVAGSSLTILFPSPALSQQPYDANDPSGIGDNQLRSFARAYLEVEKIRESYEPQLAETQDPQRGKEIEKEAISKIGEVISHQGLTPQSYSQIVQTANANDELRKRILELIKEEKNKS
jgi:hypothetical protein